MTEQELMDMVAVARTSPTPQPAAPPATAKPAAPPSAAKPPAPKPAAATSAR